MISTHHKLEHHHTHTPTQHTTIATLFRNTILISIQHYVFFFGFLNSSERNVKCKFSSYFYMYVYVDISLYLFGRWDVRMDTSHAQRDYF